MCDFEALFEPYAFFEAACQLIALMLQVVEDQERLAKQQAEIQRKFSFNIKGLSVFHSVIEVCPVVAVTPPSSFNPLHFSLLYLPPPFPPQCYKKRQPKIAEQLRKDFKLADNQYGGPMPHTVSHCCCFHL
jgi:hypothetical protein